MRKKVLLLSAYDAESHKHWRQMLTDGMDDYDWTVLTLPAHHFFWRVRSNGLSFALEFREILTAGYDVLLATSMLDLATLRGLVPELACVPSIVYFHENQFDYPISKPDNSDNSTYSDKSGNTDKSGNSGHSSYSNGERRIVNAQFSSIVTALCAQRVLFNSDYNRLSFLAGTKEFIQRMPDGLTPDILQSIEDRSATLPVPIQDFAASDSKSKNSEYINRDRGHSTNVNLVWAHRWEFDKQPEVFFNALEKLYKQPEFAASGITIQLHVMGQSFRKIPDCFQAAKQRGIHNVATWGYQTREDYYKVLATSDYAISTALHDFQGLSMLEAIHHGCIPVAPNRVAYPEYIPGALLYETGQSEQEAAALAEMLCQLLCASQNQNRSGDQTPDKSTTRPDVSRYLASNLISRYRAELEALA